MLIVGIANNQRNALFSQSVRDGDKNKGDQQT